MEQKTAAFFDFDSTLLMGDNARIGIRYLYRRGELSFFFVAGMVARQWLNRAGLYDYERMYRHALTLYRGRDITAWVRDVGTYYSENVKPLLAASVVERLRWHKLQGHVPVIISAGLRYVMEPAAADLGVERLICTDLEKGPDGRTTGRPVEPMCIGEAKVGLAKKFASDFNVDLSVSWAYSDHHSDLPLLELVGNPVAVHPDKRLFTIAKERGWPMMDWNSKVKAE